MFLGSQYKALQASRDRLSEQLARLTEDSKHLRCENAQLHNQCDVWEQFAINRDVELASLLGVLNNIIDELPDAYDPSQLKVIKAALVALAAKFEVLIVSVNGAQAQEGHDGEIENDTQVDRAGSDVEVESVVELHTEPNESGQAGLEVDVDGALQAKFVASNTQQIPK
ncbi:hypothetical protein TWF696_008637 [Orbilia brochopaga]|uniref:Uncharacterized protein n=1 Tax=Orbilia brochopaga TaxID=3140254 RepID=A0AAV9UL09_9PEZI